MFSLGTLALMESWRYFAGKTETGVALVSTYSISLAPVHVTAETGKVALAACGVLPGESGPGVSSFLKIA